MASQPPSIDGLENELVVSANSPTRRRFSIKNFRAENYQNDVLSTHSYLITLSPFSIRSDTASPLSKFVNDYQDTLIMRCESAILPGPNLMTANDIRRYGYGPVENMPHGVIFNDLTLTFSVDKRGLVTKFYNDWINSIVSYDTSEGGRLMDEGGRTQKGNIPFDPYEVGYKDDYANYKMTIFVYDRTNETVMEYYVYDCFPKAIMDTPVQWGEQDNYIRMSVLMAFTDIRVENSSVEKFDDLSGRATPGFEIFVPTFRNALNGLL